MPLVASMEGQFISHWRILGWLFNPSGFATTQKSLLSWHSYSVAENQKNFISRRHFQGVIIAFPFNCLYLERPCNKHLLFFEINFKSRDWNKTWDTSQRKGYLMETTDRESVPITVTVITVTEGHCEDSRGTLNRHLYSGQHTVKKTSLPWWGKRIYKKVCYDYFKVFY